MAPRTIADPRLPGGAATAAAMPAADRAANYRVDLEVFSGPVDLLLYLVKHGEVDILAVPLARVAGGYLESLRLLQAIDVDLAGDFLVMASALIELKSRSLLPAAPEDLDEAAEDEGPRPELIRRLVEYQRFKDAAAILGQRAREWAARFPRPVGTRAVNDTTAEPLPQPVELWDLVRAFTRLIRATSAGQPRCIVTDDTPIQVYLDRISSRLIEQPRIGFEELLPADPDPGQVVGTLLALLELVRDGRARAEQAEPFGPIWITRAGGEASGDEPPGDAGCPLPSPAHESALGS